MKPHRMSIVMIAVLLMITTGYRAGASEYPERWNYVSGNILTDASTEKLIAMLQVSAEAKCTHVLFVGSRGFRIPELTARQLENAKRVRDTAKKLNLKIIPSIISIGYSGKYFHVDSNLAAGVPVKRMPFVVSGTTAAPDPVLALDASTLRSEKGRLAGEFTVKPFMYYRISFYLTARPTDLESLVHVTSLNGKRTNSYTNPTITQRGDRFFAQTVFNTLEGDFIHLSINHGDAGVSDVRIESAGMLLILKRDRLPLIVTNEDGSVVYEEGRDFKPVSDPIVMKRPFPGDFFIDHPAPLIELTDDSRIADGQRLMVSFYHHVRIYTDQDLISIEDPAVWDILETEVREVVNLWKADGYMLNYDEIRVAGWEPRPGAPFQTMGQRLAAHFRRSYDLVKKYAPDAKVYTWSDMFTPYHNARPFEKKGYYYLVNGNWNGSWNGLPKDVGILNWYSPDERMIRFFADRGHDQILCGFYDGKSEDKMKGNIARWKRVSEGVPNIRGVMYTTWHANYEQLNDYFRLLDSFDTWSKQPADK